MNYAIDKTLSECSRSTFLNTFFDKLWNFFPAWIGNNKLATFLGICLFCFVITTIALASQKSSLEDQLADCRKNQKVWNKLQLRKNCLVREITIKCERFQPNGGEGGGESGNGGGSGGNGGGSGGSGGNGGGSGGGEDGGDCKDGCEGPKSIPMTVDDGSSNGAANNAKDVKSYNLRSFSKRSLRMKNE